MCNSPLSHDLFVKIICHPSCCGAAICFSNTTLGSIAYWFCLGYATPSRTRNGKCLKLVGPKIQNHSAFLGLKLFVLIQTPQPPLHFRLTEMKSDSKRLSLFDFIKTLLSSHYQHFCITPAASHKCSPFIYRSIYTIHMAAQLTNWDSGQLM